MRKAVWSLAFALVVACAGDQNTATTAATVSTTAGPTTTNALPASTSNPSTVTTESPRTTTARDGAPDFTLQLGDGSDFVLSAEQKPVFLVFWAEW
ncbi:MAG TPA: hypothetical protein VFT54_05295 [Acidimicrobiia bacterium]|nr:hypothetical protein [Acidimicrobiia bacterium]